MHAGYLGPISDSDNMNERVVPRQPGEWENCNSYVMYLRHLAAYRFAQPMIEEGRVLDLGSGAGYGTSILADGARQVVALDVALSALLISKVEANSLASVAADGAWLPFRSETFELVVSFQVIEHIRDESLYLDEVARILTPGGLFVVSTPNKVLRLLPFQPPFNPYHVREYDYCVLKEVLERRFAKVDVCGLYGTPEIMAIERERLRQNPLRVYAELIAQKTLPLPLSQRFRRLVGSLHQIGGSKSKEGAYALSQPFFSENNFSVDDFWIAEDGVEGSLDLIGICRKD